MTKPILDVRNLRAGYGDATVLRDVSISVPPGNVVAMLGPNGAGKTTLLRCAAGLVRARAGEIDLDDEDVTALQTEERARRGLCLIPEGRGVFPTLSVKENVLMFTPKGAQRDALERAVHAQPVLGSHLQRTAGTLSGGEQQMLALVRAWLADPKVVLVDEPSMGLAPMMVDRVFAFLSDIAEQGTSVLLVEQYVTRALALADCVYLLSNGEVAFTGSGEQLRDENIFDLFEHYVGVRAHTVGPPSRS